MYVVYIPHMQLTSSSSTKILNQMQTNSLNNKTGRFAHIETHRPLFIAHTLSQTYYNYFCNFNTGTKAVLGYLHAKRLISSGKNRHMRIYGGFLITSTYRYEKLSIILYYVLKSSSHCSIRKVCKKVSTPS